MSYTFETSKEGQETQREIFLQKKFTYIDSNADKNDCQAQMKEIFSNIKIHNLPRKDHTQIAQTTPLSCFAQVQPDISQQNISFEKFIKNSNSAFNVLRTTDKYSLSNLDINPRTNNFFPTESKKLLMNFIPKKHKSNAQSTRSRINSYFEWKHLLEMGKISNIRREKLMKECEELRQVPCINEHSKKMIVERRNNEFDSNTVFERLSDYKQKIQKQAKINKIEKQSEMCYTYEPQINHYSKEKKRNLNDLFEWKKQKEEKRKREIQKANVSSIMLNYTNQLSEEILKDLHPDYLQKKVEVRLQELGAKTNAKIKFLREKSSSMVGRSRSKPKEKNVPNSSRPIFTNHATSKTQSNDKKKFDDPPTTEKLLEIRKLLSNMLYINIQKHNTQGPSIPSIPLPIEEKVNTDSKSKPTIPEKNGLI